MVKIYEKMKSAALKTMYQVGSGKHRITFDLLLASARKVGQRLFGASRTQRDT